MKNIWTIAKREYDYYFNSPTAYVVAFVILFILGFIFAATLLFVNQNAQYGYAEPPDITQVSWWFAFLLMLGVPAITMRLIGDESNTGTIELMLTAPVRDHEFIIGKWLGSFLYILTIMLLTLVYPIILDNMLQPGIDWKLVTSSYIGLILIAASFLALGVGISAIFPSQIAAFFVTLIACFGLFFFIGIPAGLLQNGGQIFDYLAIRTHFDGSLNRGTINLSDLVYFFSLIALGLFSGTTAIEIRRWR